MPGVAYDFLLSLELLHISLLVESFVTARLAGWGHHHHCVAVRVVGVMLESSGMEGGLGLAAAACTSEVVAVDLQVLKHRLKLLHL